MSLPAVSRIPFGGDHDPEQWPAEVRAEDQRLFDAARIDTVTLGAFAWSHTRLAPDREDRSCRGAAGGRRSRAASTKSFRNRTPNLVDERPRQTP